MRNLSILPFLLTFFLLVTPAFAQLELGDWWSFDYFWSEALGLPGEWAPTESVRNFIFNFLVPFIALYAILLGIIRALGMFRTTPSIELIIAFAMAFMTLPSKIFIAFVSFTLGLAGIWGYIVFLAMFLGGSYFYGVGFLRKHKTQADIYVTYSKEVNTLREERKSLYEKITKLEKEISSEDLSLEQIQDRMKKIKKLREELDTINKRLEALRYASQTVTSM